MSYASIKIISFDVTGTLVDPYPSIGAIYSEILQKFGVHLSEPELEIRFLAEFHRSRARIPQTINEEVERSRWEEVVRRILAEQYSEPIFKELWATMGQGRRWKPKPRLTRTLKTLQEQGFRLVVVSNWDQRLYGILADLNLSHFFEAVFISSELGVEKPSVTVYEQVARRLETFPGRLLHVGNSPAKDFKPALRAGWNALLLHNRIPHGMEPGTILGSIDQLPAVLKSEKGGCLDWLPG